MAATIAARQHGIVTRAQLREAGASIRRIQLRVRSGALRVVHRGVYLVGPLTPPLAAPLAACLACGPDAVVSHRSAARLWGMIGPAGADDPVDTTISRSNRRKVGVRVHRSRTLLASERTRTEGVPVTTPSRTLLDLASCVSSREVERALATACALRIVTTVRVRDCLERHPSQPGAAILRAVVGAGEPVRTRSDAEERMLGLLRSARIPTPRVNTRIGPYEVDFHWPDARLVLEVDGFATHGLRRAFERDRRRDAHLAGRGLRVMRVTWQQIDREPEWVVFQLGRAMGAAR